MLNRNKSKSNIRVIFQNINGLGTDDDTDKRSRIINFVKDWDVDIMALAEVNINWKVAPFGITNCTVDPS